MASTWHKVVIQEVDRENNVDYLKISVYTDEIELEDCNGRIIKLTKETLELINDEWIH